jgi:hypothetical protein
MAKKCKSRIGYQHHSHEKPASGGYLMGERVTSRQLHQLWAHLNESRFSLLFPASEAPITFAIFQAT